MESLKKIVEINRLNNRHNENAYMNLIRSKKLIEEINTVLSEMEIEIPSKILLFALFLYFYPDFVEDETCIALSHSVYNSIFQNNDGFRNYLILFDRALQQYRHRDKQETVSYSIDYYNQLELSKKFMKEPTEIEALEQVQNKIERNLLKIYNVNVRDHLRADNSELIKNTLIESVISNAEKAYGDLIEQQVQGGNYEMVIKCIADIKKQLQDYHAEEYKQEFEERIDMEFIEILITRGAYEPSNLKNLIEFIFHAINRIAPNKVETSRVREICLKSITEADKWDSNTWGRVLSLCITSIYKRLQCLVRIGSV